MIADLPITTWILFIVAVGAGLAVEWSFLRRHGRNRRR
jgi:hypothetical protein